MLLQKTNQDEAVDRDQAQALKRIKWLASGLLLGCVFLLIIAKLLERHYPAFGFVAAFAEAATIGGFADWYAVVALFRHPMGLPIPHTAIIAKNQNRIADSLARFIETNFLDGEPVRQKLNEVDFAGLMSDWLVDETRASTLSRFAMRLLPQAMQKADTSRLKEFLASRIKQSVEQINIAPLAANLLNGLTENRRHQKILDEILDALGRLLLEPSSVEGIYKKIRDELPSLLKFFKADSFLLRKIIGSAAGLIEEVKGNPDHPLRGEVDRVVDNFIEHLRTSPEYHQRLDDMKTSLLNRPETAQLFQIAWDSLKTFIEEDAAKPDSTLERQLRQLLMAVAKQLKEDARLRQEVNAGMVTVLETFIANQKGAISQFISGQVKAWDIVHMTTIIETNIGRDLQYIRFNGTLIGGAIGVALYTFQLLFGLR